MTNRTLPEWDASDIEVGKPIRKSLLERIKNNDINHEERLNNLEQFSNKVDVFNFEVIGFINHYTTPELAQIATFKATRDFQLTEIRLTLMNSINSPASSSTGELSIDIKASNDNGITWASILETPPKIVDGISATGSISGPVTFIPSGNSILSGTFLRVDVTSKKDIQGTFHVQVFGEV